MKKIYITKSLVIILTLLIFSNCNTEPDSKRILIFSKTAGFRHKSIETGVDKVVEIAKSLGYDTEHTENSNDFNEANLKRFKAVVFLSTTGDALEFSQEIDFQRFIQAGGGYMGIHAASDTEYDWEWYGQLVGAYFVSHPQQQTAKINVVDATHPSTDSLPEVWERWDEWYNYKYVNDDINVLLMLDENSYEGGENGDYHPIAWYHEFDGGRSFYTGLGHTIDSFSEPLFKAHIKGGLEWILAGPALDYKKVSAKRPPESNRYTKVVLESNLNEPTEMTILPGGTILVVERKGAIKEYNPATEKVSKIGEIEVYTEFEDGLMGITKDPNFTDNGWIYMYYSYPGEEPKQHLSRFSYANSSIDMDSEIVLLEVGTQREECCHTGGSLTFDENGNLFLSTGDNTNPFESSGFGPFDEREGRSPFDAQSSSANPNDLRGKILRIHPEPDGTYTIPEGNLFPPGTEGTRPEIYVMGNRNPYRISYDKRTGFLYWGEVGPDSGEDSLETRGPRGYDEVNQARQAGNFGWPLFIADNKPYIDYDFASMTSYEPFDVNAPVNNSPNNTGMQNLPPAQPAFIWYPYAKSTEFPMVGEGGRNAMAGPVYYSSDFDLKSNSLPAYLDNKLIIYDWIRDWVIAVTMDDNGDYKYMEPLMPDIEFSNPMDMELDEHGVLYVLEYGEQWFSQNPDAVLARIDFNGGNRPPVITANNQNTIGAAPLEVVFSAVESMDFDGDELSYNWDTGDGNTFTVMEFNHIYTEPGIYNVVLSVSDGESSSQEMFEIWVGNQPAELSIEVDRNSRFFWPDEPLKYIIKGLDSEDGTIAEGNENIWVSVDLLTEGFDETMLAQGHQGPINTIVGKQLMEGSDCSSCHNLTLESIGPTYLKIAEKYEEDPEAGSYLENKIKNGGGGVWGEQAMAAHPQLEDDEISKMVDYILSVNNDGKNSEPMSGEFLPDKEVSLSSRLIIRASYVDQGANGIPSLTSSETLSLRPPMVVGSDFTGGDGYERQNGPGNDAISFNRGGWAVLEDIDLNGISNINLSGSMQRDSETIVEFYAGSREGDLIASGMLVDEGPTELEGIRRASTQVPISSSYIGNIVVQFSTNSEIENIGSIAQIEFAKK